MTTDSNNLHLHEWRLSDARSEYRDQNIDLRGAYWAEVGPNGDGTVWSWEIFRMTDCVSVSVAGGMAATEGDAKAAVARLVTDRWVVVRTDIDPDVPWGVYYSEPQTLDPNSDAACIDGGTHATWAEAFAAALEGAQLTAKMVMSS